MPKYFPSITHQIVITTKTKEDMDAMEGTVALIVHCFSDDSDKLSPIRIKKMSGPTLGVTAEIPQTRIIYNGKSELVSILKGKPAAEIKQMSCEAFDKVKQKYGLKFGKAYKVFANTVEEMPLK